MDEPRESYTSSDTHDPNDPGGGSTGPTGPQGTAGQEMWEKRLQKEKDEREAEGGDPNARQEPSREGGRRDDKPEEPIPFSGDTDKAAPLEAEEDKGGTGGDVDVLPEAGGYYPGRDPKKDMPRIPTIPETQDDPRSHDAPPDPNKPERSASE